MNSPKQPPRRRRKETTVKIVYPHCAGVDIHKDSMTVCVFADAGNGSAPEYHKRNFPTHSEGIREFESWLKQYQVTEVGLESTGVYWKPVWNALEGRFGLHLCNPQHTRAIPGHKTDLQDGTRIAELLAHGMLPESFIPPQWQRELRDLTRLRVRMVQESTRTGNRIGKVLEDAQIKLGSVASDVLGVSGRAMLEALAKGETDATKLAELAQGKLKSKKAQLRKVLEGNVRDHHRFQISILLEHLKECEEKTFQLDCRIDRY